MNKPLFIALDYDDQEKMWLWVTLKPIDKRIAITL